MDPASPRKISRRDGTVSKLDEGCANRCMAAQGENSLARCWKDRADARRCLET
jgi:hypothetical protein